MIAGTVRGADQARRAVALMLIAAGGQVVDCRSAIAADADYGQYLAAECAACHRPGDSDGAVPGLHARSHDDLVAALKEYREGVRSDAAMQAVARSLGDAEIEALAAYFSGRP